MVAWKFPSLYFKQVMYNVLTKWNMQRADISMGGPLFIFCCFVLGMLRYFFLTLCKLGWFR